MGTSVSSCQQKAKSEISSHQNGDRIALLATTNCFSAAPSRVAMVAATSPSESDDAALRTLDTAEIRELVAAAKLARWVFATEVSSPLEACVATEAESVILSSSLVLKRAKSRTVKLSSEQPKST